MSMPTDLQKKLQLWKDHPDNRKLWDFRLRCDDDTTVPASLVDLVASSSYFETLCFSSAQEGSEYEVVLDDTTQEEDLITLKGVSGTALYSIVESIYSRSPLPLDDASVVDVYEAAEKLQFEDVLKQCKQYMLANINHATAVAFLSLATKHTLQDLHVLAKQHITSHIIAIVHHARGGADFTSLHPEEILELLTSSKACCGVQLLDLYDRLQCTGITAQQLRDLTNVDQSSTQELHDICGHPLALKDADLLAKVALASLKRLRQCMQDTSKLEKLTGEIADHAATAYKYREEAARHEDAAKQAREEAAALCVALDAAHAARDHAQLEKSMWMTQVAQHAQHAGSAEREAKFWKEKFSSRVSGEVKTFAGPGYKLAHVWRVTDLATKCSLGTKVSSTKFDILGKGMFQVDLYPKGRLSPWGNGSCSVFVTRDGKVPRGVDLTVGIALMDLTDKPMGLFSNTTNVRSISAPLADCGWGWDNFCVLHPGAQQAPWYAKVDYIKDDSIVLAVVCKP